MAEVTALQPEQKPARPVIDRDPGWCLMHLSNALAALQELTELEGISNKNDQLNILMRTDLASLFAVLHDYADAARRAIPEERA